jgi:Ca2+-binding RTX toxin-like protein
VACRGVASLLLVLVLAAPGAASARVALVATGTPEAALLDVATNVVVARAPLAGPSRAVAISADGRRGFAAGGSAVAAIDLGVTPAGPGGVAPAVTATRDLGGPVIGLAAAGGRVVAAAGRSLHVLDPVTLRVVRRVDLRGPAGAVALSPGGSLAAVALRSGRVALVDVGAGRLLRRVKLHRVLGVAVDAGRRTWVTTARARLHRIAPGARRPARGKRLGAGVGGALALSPDASTLAVGALAGARTAALVDLGTGRLRRFRSGRGPGAPGWSPDGVRVYLAEAGAGALSLVSALGARRIGTVALPGTTPAAVVVQPGRAHVAGTDLGEAIVGTRLQDVLDGLGGDDRLAGGRESDVLLGGDGADDLRGGSYDDRLDGAAGDDVLSGGSGNDRLDGGDGADRGDGGTGNDSVHGGEGADVFDGGAGDDRVYGEGGDDQIVEAGFGNDRRLYGGPGNDLIRGGRGSDLIKGGDGDDRLEGQSGTESITGGDGDDAIEGGASRDLLGGNNGSDVVRGDSGNDLVQGGAGADQLDGGSGEDDLVGDEGADLVVGGPGPDLVEAGAGDDTIRVADDSRDEVDCGTGSDTVFVEAGAPARDALIDCETVTPVPAEAANDADRRSVVSGTRGDDLMRGTPLEDSLFGKAGADRMFGAGGPDYVDGEWGADELHGGPGDDTMAGRSGDDRIFGEDGDDTITGDRGEDRIAGGGGADQLFGNLDPDVVSGGSGDDRINVVRGDLDEVRCGAGRDVVLADPRDQVARDCEDVRR